MKIKHYIELMKPGIIFGNGITALSGFALASHGKMAYALLFFTLLGLSCVIGSACTLNNYIDRHTDERMSRTEGRVLVQKIVSDQRAIILAIALGIFGILILVIHTFLLTVLLTLLGFLIYTTAYTLLKYHSSHATLIGSLSGALPPVIGYSAVLNTLDLSSYLLFIIMVFWQMSHFFAIAIYRLNDYTQAGIPVLPVVKGIYETKVHMLIYTTLFLGATLTLFLLGYTGLSYGICALLLGLIWILLALQGFKTTNDRIWARRMFLISLIIIMVLSITLTIETYV